jgi:hypothetical protein
MEDYLKELIEDFNREMGNSMNFSNKEPTRDRALNRAMAYATMANAVVMACNIANLQEKESPSAARRTEV